MKRPSLYISSSGKVIRYRKTIITTIAGIKPMHLNAGDKLVMGVKTATVISYDATTCSVNIIID